MKLANAWDSKKIRYIKLGDGGKWWEECLDRKIIRLGFNSGSPEVFDLAKSGDWESLKKYWTSYRRLAGDGWKNTDVEGNELRQEGLSSRLTKTAGYRGTICGLKEDVEEYLRNRLECKVSSDLVKAISSKSKLEKSIQPLIQFLTDGNFELLVELIFANSGWRKTTSTGGNQKTTDLDLYNPITSQQIWVQVKTKTDPKEFRDYVEKHYSDRSNFETMYYVYHTCNVGEILNEDPQISVWDIETVATQVVANGLVDWVLNKSK